MASVNEPLQEQYTTKYICVNGICGIMVNRQKLKKQFPPEHYSYLRFDKNGKFCKA